MVPITHLYARRISHSCSSGQAQDAGGRSLTLNLIAACLAVEAEGEAISSRRPYKQLRTTARIPSTFPKRKAEAYACRTCTCTCIHLVYTEWLWASLISSRILHLASRISHLASRISHLASRISHLASRILHQIPGVAEHFVLHSHPSRRRCRTKLEHVAKYAEGQACSHPPTSHLSPFTPIHLSPFTLHPSPPFTIHQRRNPIHAQPASSRERDAEEAIWIDIGRCAGLRCQLSTCRLSLLHGALVVVAALPRLVSRHQLPLDEPSLELNCLGHKIVPRRSLALAMICLALAPLSLLLHVVLCGRRSRRQHACVKLGRCRTSSPLVIVHDLLLYPPLLRRAHLRTLLLKLPVIIGGRLVEDGVLFLEAPAWGAAMVRAGQSSSCPYTGQAACRSITRGMHGSHSGAATATARVLPGRMVYNRGRPEGRLHLCEPPRLPRVFCK